MAGGGLMQLVAYGAQDVYLTGKPEITFFKAVYKRHTNFAMETISQVFSGTPGFGTRVTCPIARNGDLLTKMYLHVVLKGPATNAQVAGTQEKKWSWVPQVGHALIDTVELEVGGSKIDKQYGQWMNVWHHLTRSEENESAYATMVGDTVEAGEVKLLHDDLDLYIPLQFFCCRNNGLALPLIALQYHDVRINFEFSKASDCVNYGSGHTTAPAVSIDTCELLVDTIFLDTEERKRFAQSSHEYLIEQVQFSGEETVNSTSHRPDLHFNHPCKALVWTFAPDAWKGKHLAYHPDKQKMRELITKYALAHIPAASSTPASKALVGSIAQTVAAAGSWDGYTTTAKALVTVGGYYQMRNLETAYAIAYTPITTPDTYKTFNPDAFVLTGPVLPDEIIAQGAQACVNYVRNGAAATTNVIYGSVQVNLHNLYSSGLTGGEPLAKASLQLNGQDRFKEQNGAYFSQVQSYQHWPHAADAGVYSYSFAVNPADHQPSGTCNMSRIDNAQLNLTMVDGHAKNSKLRIFAVNYNVLRVMSGMGGLAYSN